ncbi:DNA repair protein RecO [Roseivirga sp. BDSF3-8]|uniref:DNA repair protein RecO n=1 Tax=Roseivirga sp. BDSF3-8 TaxID=3241598 RepID=UPI003531E1DB
MLSKTRGIVLNFIRYKDTSIIVKIYTEAFGLRTYIVNGVRSNRSKASKIAFYQPLTLLDLVVYNQEQREIHRLSETKCSKTLQSIPFEPVKGCMALFITEMLSKVLREEESNKELFSFIYHSVEMLDMLESQYQNFHIQFLLKLAAFLGFGLTSEQEFFGQVHHSPNDALAVEESRVAAHLLKEPFTLPVNCARSVRAHLLELTLDFYKMHVESLGEVKSLPVLREVMR